MCPHHPTIARHMTKVPQKFGNRLAFSNWQQLDNWTNIHQSLTRTVEAKKKKKRIRKNIESLVTSKDGISKTRPVQDWFQD